MKKPFDCGGRAVVIQ